MRRLLYFAIVIGSYAAVLSAQSSSSSTSLGSTTQLHGAATALPLAGGTVVVAGETGATEVWDPVLSAFRAAAGTRTPRLESTTVALADGRVLNVGGLDEDGALATADIYDPASDQFVTATGGMVASRVRPSVTVLRDGRVLVIGGGAASAELFDPATGLFTAAATPNSVARGPAALLSSGDVLLAGGVTGQPTGSAEVFSPAANSFTPVGSLAAPRHGHQLTLLPDSRVLVTGGYNENGNPIAEAELFDPLSGRFSAAGALSTARGDHAAVALATGEVLVLGGRNDAGVLDSAEIYEPGSNRFQPAGTLLDRRASPAAAQLPDGRVFVAAGRGGSGEVLTAAEALAVQSTVKQITAASLSSNTATSVYGQAVTYLVTVTGARNIPRGTVTFLDGGTLVLGSAALDAQGRATLTTTATPAGQRAITARYEGSWEAEPSTSPAWTQSVSAASAAATLSVSPLSQAYSDPVTLEVTVTGAYGDAPAKGVNFKIGSQQMNGEPVAFKDAGGGTWKAILRNQPLLETSPAGQLRPNGMMKIVSASFSGPNPGYVMSNPSSKALLVTKEDSRPTYDGPRTVTASKGSSTVTVPLRATIRDITVTSDAGGDRWAGDVRLAQVTFVNRETNAAIATVSVKLVNDGDTTTGVAKYDWTVDSKPRTYTVGMIVSNYYQRNSTADNASITVSKQ